VSHQYISPLAKLDIKETRKTKENIILRLKIILNFAYKIKGLSYIGDIQIPLLIITIGVLIIFTGFLRK